MTRPVESRARSVADARGGAGSLPLFLSLFLLLLAFFVFLNSISSLEVGKSDQVLKSVRASFPSIFKGGQGAAIADAAGQAFDPGVRERIAAVLVEARPLLADTPYVDGDPIYADFQADELFPAGSFRPHPTFERVLAALAPIINAPGEGRRLDLSLMLGYQPGDDDLAPLSRLERLRVASLGDSINRAGIEGPRAAVGFEPRAPGRLRLSIDAGSAGTRGLDGGRATITGGRR